MAGPVASVLAYPRTIHYAQAWMTQSGQRRERHVNAMRELGRPTMATIIEGIAARRTIREVPAETLAARDDALDTAVLDTPAGMLPCHRYRQHQVMMISNNGSLPRCQLEEFVYRAGVHWLWQSRCDDQLFRRLFAESFHSRSHRLTWFVDPLEDNGEINDQTPTAGPTAGPSLVYCGRLDPEKRIDWLIYLLFRLHDLNVELALVGAFEPTAEGAAYRQHIGALIKALNLSGRVHLRGFLSGSELAAALAGADLLVNLTVNHDETFGLAQVEALCQGTPVLAAAWGGLKDVVTPACGYLADTLVTAEGTFVDMHAAEQFVRRIIGDAGLRARMAAAARARGAHFCWSRFLADLDGHLAATSPPVPGLDPASTVAALVQQVLSPALLERITPYLNPLAMEQTLDEIHTLRNGTLLGAQQWQRFAIIDPQRHDAFVREHYQFIYEPYGTLTPERAAARLAGGGGLFPLRPELRWRGDVAAADDPVFGARQYPLSPAAVRLLRGCTAAPGISITELAKPADEDDAATVAAVQELLCRGLILPERPS